MSDESGRGDPTRTLELLWGVREPPTRGPKPALTVERIVEAAIALADAEGLAAVSMRRLATALGTGTMSLYRYVPGKPELVDLMLDTVFREVGPPPEGAGWREALEHYARGIWDSYRRHPWSAPAETRPVLGPGSLDRYEGMLRAVAATGLPPGEVVNATELVGHYVAGAARRAAEEEPDPEWWAEREPFWEHYFDVERYPTITALYEAGAFEAREDAFEFGLQRVLDGIDVRCK